MINFSFIRRVFVQAGVGLCCCFDFTAHYSWDSVTVQLVCATFPIQTMTGAEISELGSNASELIVTPGGHFEEHHKADHLLPDSCPRSLSGMVAACPPVLTSSLFDHSRNKTNYKYFNNFAFHTSFKQCEDREFCFKLAANGQTRLSVWLCLT